LTEETGDEPRRRSGRGGLSSRDGLTNGDVTMEGLDVGTGLINGMGGAAGPPKGRGLPLLGGSRRKRRAARKALERKAREPLPGADGD
jgi:hypothetical protein